MMDVQQESNKAFEDIKIEIIEHFLPTETVKREVIFNEKDDKLNIQNEIFSIKQENSAVFSIKQENSAELYTEKLQKTFINADNDCNQVMNDVDMRYKLRQQNFKKQNKKGNLARKKHMKYWVSHKGILMCKFCGNMFNRKFEMFCHAAQHFVQKVRHMRKARINATDVFIKSSKNVLVQNISTHTNEKAFKCEVCSKSFTLKSNLVEHIRSHTGEKPFKCNFCSKSFTKKSNLVGHIRSHTGEKPFKCNFCSKSFTKKYNLVGHIRSHTGEKPFQCNVCPKSYAAKKSLVGHMRVHIGERPI